MLFLWANNEGGNIYPSHKTIADKIGMDERQVKRVIKKLEIIGALIWTGKWHVNHKLKKQTKIRQIVLAPWWGYKAHENNVDSDGRWGVVAAPHTGGIGDPPNCGIQLVGGREGEF
jgi:hypothetical protein